MGEAVESVKLHAMWASPWVRRVRLALAIKGIPYEYIEEDLKNKSQLLLKYNPVKKLVPVLVHDGKPIPESLIIMEYIDEIWDKSPRLLPSDPCHRSKIRFWANFIDLQLFERLRDVIKARDDQLEERFIQEIQESMSKLEENVKDLSSGAADGECMEMLDILMVTLLPIIKGVEEAINVQFIDPGKFPLAFSWMRSRDGFPMIESSAPNHENLVKFLQSLRRYFRKIAL